VVNEIEIVVKVRDQATAEIAALEARVKALKEASAAAGESSATFSTDLDDEGLRAKVIEAVKAAEHGINVIVGADVDADGLRERVEAKAAAAGAGAKVEVPVEGDTSKLDQDVTSKVKRTKPEPIKVPVETDAEAFEKELRASFAEGEKNAQSAEKAMTQSFSAMASGSRLLQAAMKEIAPVAHDAGDAAEDFETQFRKAMDEGARVSEEADRAMRGSFTSVESGSRTLRAAMADLEPPLDNAGKKASESSGGFSIAALKMTGMITAALALAPALAALPAVGAAITVGMGTMSLGLGGVVSALKDYGAQSTASGQSGAQLAQTAFSNALAIRNAEQAIADAKKQAARAAQSSADQIYSAQERVAQATYGVQQAQKSLADAEQSATQAQRSLTQAYADATNQLVDLNNAAADSSIAVEQAELRLTEARQNLAQVTGSSLSTDDQKRQAQIDLMSATQGLKDAQQKQIESQQAADAANQTGVSGMQTVVSAQNAVQKANEGVANAQHGVASATLAQTDAQTALARAVQASAQQQADSAQAIAKAEQNLSDTYEQQKLAAAAAASAGGGAADKFAADMAKLTPAGQAFVNQLLSMRSGLDQLKATAQTSMLPGLTAMLQSSGPLLPIFNKAIGDMGAIIGNTAKSFGALMQSPAFQGQLTKVLAEGSGLAGSFASGLSGMVSGITQAASKAGPIVAGIGNGIKLLMTSGIPDFLNGLVTNASQIGQGFQGVLTIVSNLAGPLGTVASAVGAALAPGIQVLASPQVQQALQSIATSIAQILIVLAPVVTMFAQGLAGALRIAAPLLQSVAKFMQDNNTWVVPLAKGIAAAAVAWWGLNAAMAANPLVLIGTLIAGLVIGLIYAWEHFKGFRDFMQAMWRDIKVGFDAFLGFIKQWWPELLAPFTLGLSMIIGHWNDIVDFVKKLPGRLASAAEHTWDWVTQTWDKYVAGPVSKNFDSFIGTVGGLPGRIARAGAGIWDWIKTEFLGVINGIAGVWNQLRFSTPSFHIPIPFTDGINVDSVSVGVPPIGPFKAAGGPIRGGLSAVIGDRGWEPLRMPDGTVVIPHANARQAMADSAASAGGAQAHLEWVGPEGDELFTMIKRWIRVRYGTDPNSVQKALGQSF
jgi:hypothetical protein